MRKEKKALRTGKKWLIAISLLVCSLLIGTAIGAAIVVFPIEDSQGEQKKGYLVTENGYSGNSSQDLLRPVQEETFIAQVNQKVSASIVTIVTEYTVDTFFGSTGAGNGIGTGVVYQINENQVYVITNAHVVNGADRVYLYGNSKEKIPAILKGMDEKSDIAVISIDKTEIPEDILRSMRAIEWGDSETVRVGDHSIAIGCPYGVEFGNSVTVGIIGGTEREITYDGVTLTVLQTDAAINPGNSGGALVNKDGKLIGINTAKIQMDSVEGMGFAIPSNIVKPIVEKLVSDGSIEHPELGIASYEFIVEAIAEMYHIPTGIMVYEIERGSAGWKAGLQAGDLITEIDGQKLEELENVSEILDAHKVGDVVMITVIRNRNANEALQLQLQLSGSEPEVTIDFWGNAK